MKQFVLLWFEISCICLWLRAGICCILIIFFALKNHNFQSYVETVLIMKKTKIEEIHIRFLKFRKFLVCLTTPPNLSGIGWKTFAGERIKVDHPIFRPNSGIFPILEILILTWERRNQYTDDSELVNVFVSNPCLLR